MKSLYVALLALVLFSCHNNKETAPLSELNDKVTNIETADTTYDQEKQPQGNSKQKQQPKQSDKAAPPVVDWTQKIIKTANINLELKDYHPFNNSLHQSLATFGAYIAQEQQQENEGQITNEMSIKVPVSQFENLVNILTSDTKNKVLQKQITSADVTAEYADTKSREETKRQVRAKYQQFMSDAHKIDDVLQLQSEINSITEDIEAAAGRVKYLSHQSAYSTINLKYFQVLDASKANDDAEPGFGIQFINALKTGGSFIGQFILLLVSIWPLLLIGCGVWYYIRKKNIFRSRPQPQQVNKS